MSLTHQAKMIILDHFSIQNHQAELAIDCTCGNGHDSVFLAGIAKQLIGFDIQPQAILSTRQLLKKQQINCNIQLLNVGHENLLQSLDSKAPKKKADVIMFNLGYLPKSDNLGITTQANTTKVAINQSMIALSPQGILTILCYRGHPQGGEEFYVVLNEINKLDSSIWNIEQIDSRFPSESTPVLFVIRRHNNHTKDKNELK